MQIQQSFATTDRNRPLPAARAIPEVLETLLSALAGCGIVMLLAFLLSLEAWVVAAAG
jgi:hypothetical protein